MKWSILLPNPLKQYLLQMHQKWIWRRYYPRFEKSAKNNTRISLKLLSRLIYGWGNQGFSAKSAYLQACIEEVRSSNRPVLECGSGLTTVLLGLICQQRGLMMVTLEHHQDWVERVQQALNRAGVDTLQLLHSPLIAKKGYSWYSTAGLPDNMDQFGVIICDGPPAQTPGGRYGLVPEMASYIKEGTIILVDDTIREQEQQMIQKWGEHLSFDRIDSGNDTPFAILKVK